MCMTFECKIERKQIIGWKVIKFDGYRYITPYLHMLIEIGHRYESHKWDPAENIYIFLNKIYAKKFLKWISKVFIFENFHLAKVKLGNHVWKGRINIQDEFIGLENEYFFTTDSIEVLEVE